MPTTCHRWWPAATLLICLTTAAAPSSWGAEPHSHGPAKPAVKPTAVEEAPKLADPGPPHESLRAMSGKWKAETKTWDAQGQPTMSEGVAIKGFILGGRFLKMDFVGTLMGQPFTGYGLIGYDNRRRHHTMFWVDNSSTAMMMGTGSANEAGNELTFTATGEGPDGKPMEYKMVTQIVDADRHVFTMFGKKDGQDQPVMVITYTRIPM